LLEAAVEPHRAVERRLLVHEDVLEVVAERLKILFARKIFLDARPAGERIDDAADQLFDAVLAFGRSNLPTKILGDDDVGRLLRPESRNLDVTLFEDDLTALVPNHCGPAIPFDFVKRIDAGFGEEPRKHEARGGRGRLLGPCFSWLRTG